MSECNGWKNEDTWALALSMENENYSLIKEEKDNLLKLSDDNLRKQLEELIQSFDEINYNNVAIDEIRKAIEEF